MGGLNWARDGADWPNREASRFVTAGGITWHVQCAGSGPTLLLLHGTGASTHSWRDLLPALAARFSVVAPDLPGHAFTSTLPVERQSLPGMADAIEVLLQALGRKPELAVGHSAGAALLARLGLDARIDPRWIVSLNGAFLPYGGAAFHWLRPLTRLFAGSRLVATLLARSGGNVATMRQMIERTGSVLDARGLQLYARLTSSPGHVAGALSMMAGWELEPLVRDLPRLRQPLLLLVGTGDRTIDPAQADRVAALAPFSRIVRLPGLGHLAHEERPDEVTDLIGRLADDVPDLG